MNILGIETSCDDTCAALVKVLRGKCEIVSNASATQINLHKKYGGVVPELAARTHIESIIHVIKKATGNKKIDAIAITSGPGLITSLHVGVETAKALSFAWNIPIIKVNHIEGHIYSVLLKEKNIKSNRQKIKFPAIALIVSGGHTELILIEGYGNYKLIGRTRDDASGEAFDKSAKMLGLPYPGGPQISKLGEKGNPSAFDIPRPMITSDNCDFSFSGMKNAIRLLVEEIKTSNKRISKKTMQDLCASIEQAIVDVLVEKSQKAIKKYKTKTFILGGGVSANKKLRLAFEKSIPKKIQFLYPDTKFCMDNAPMIAIAGYFKFKKTGFTKYNKLKADANWEIV